MDVDRFESLIKDRLTKTEFYKISNDSINSKEKIQDMDRRLSKISDSRENFRNAIEKSMRELDQKLDK